MSTTISVEDAGGLEAQTPTSQPQELIRRLRRENAQLRRELQRMMIFRTMAYRDCLTNLHNRRYFDERLREEGARATRMAGYAFSVILIDVDDFKTINDTHGHAQGDEVLIAVANVLKDNIREVDICCRIGGDEFALLLPTTDELGARVVLQRIRERLPRSQELFPCPVSLSLGLASSPPAPTDADTIVGRADEAMYADKRRRKGSGVKSQVSGSELSG